MAAAAGAVSGGLVNDGLIRGDNGPVPSDELFARLACPADMARCCKRGLAASSSDVLTDSSASDFVRR